jgi:predicted small lipoprotein YifL
MNCARFLSSVAALSLIVTLAGCGGGGGGGMSLPTASSSYGDVTDSTTPSDTAPSVLATTATGAVGGVVRARSEDGRDVPQAGVLVHLAASTAAAAQESADLAGLDLPPPPPTFSSQGEDYHAFTGTDGTYLIQEVPVGTYDAVALGFDLEPTRGRVTVAAGKVSELEFTLEHDTAPPPPPF